MEKNNSISKKVFLILKMITVLLGIIFLIYPYINQNIFIAKNPIDSSIFEFSRSHGFQVPFHLAWAFEGSRKIPPSLRALLLIILIILQFYKQKKTVIHKSITQHKISPYILYPLVFLSSTILFYILKVTPEVNATFGDGPTLPNEMNQGGVHGAEILTCHFFIFIRKILDTFITPPNGLLAIQISSSLSGGIFVTSILLLAKTIGQNWQERLTIFLGITFTGYLVMFFGYVETTNLELASIALYFAFASKYIFSKTKKDLWLFLSLTALSISFMSHAAGILLGASLPILLMEYKENIKRTLINIINYRNILFTLALIITPYYLIIFKPFYLKGNYGNILGGGDRIMFVTWTIDYANLLSKHTYYSMISWWHLADILSVFLIAATFSIPLIILSIILKIRDKIKFSHKDIKFILILVIAALTTTSIPILWNHDFGMWGDWNLSASYLFPLNIFAWILFTIVMREYEKNKDYFRTVTSTIIVQTLFAFGLYLQIK